MCESKKQKCCWDVLSIEAFNKVKQAFITAPILRYPDYKLPFVVHSDASNIAISAVLLQKYNGMMHPIEFAGKKLSPTEQRYTVSERELLALVYGYEQFYHHVYGRHIEFYTDHQPLVTKKNQLKKPFGRLGRLFHRLSGVDYVINYIPGPQNYLADFLSRAYEKDMDTTEANVNAIEFKSSIDWPYEQSKDQEIKEVIRCLYFERPDADWRAITNGARWLHEKRELYVEDETLMYGSNRIVVPEHMKEEILLNHHDSPFKGHRGYETTIHALNKRYYWNFMPTQVENYVRSCIKCQTYNYACIKNRAPMRSIVATRPWQLIGLDFMGPFKTTQRGNTYIILAVDHFTKYVEGAATASFNSRITAQFVHDTIICRYGMVEKILSDQGVNFESHLFHHLCILIGADKVRTSPYHPQCNGLTERTNKVIKPNLAKFVNETHDDWDMFLQMAISAYNNSYHSTIGVTPFEAMFGRPSIQVADVLLNNQLPASTKMSEVSNFIRALRLNADYISSTIRENTNRAQTRQKKYHDQNIRNKIVFKVGDLVKIQNFRVRPNHSKSFEPKFLGPFKITEMLNDLNYRIAANDSKPLVVHYDRMSYFKAREGSTNIVIPKKPSSNRPLMSNEPPRRSPRATTKTTYLEYSSDFEEDTALVISPEAQNHVGPGNEKQAGSNDENQAGSDDDTQVGSDGNNRVGQDAEVQSSPIVQVQVESDGRDQFISEEVHETAENCEETVWEETNQTIETVSPTTSTEQATYNDKGKRTTPCRFCHKLFEAQTGLRMHQYSCKQKTPEQRSPQGGGM